MTLQTFLMASSVTSFDSKFERVFDQTETTNFFCISFIFGGVKLRGSNQADKNLDFPISSGRGNELLF